MASPGQISGSSKLWHEPFCHTTGLERGSAKAGTVTSLRRDSDLPEDDNPKQGSLVTLAGSVNSPVMTVQKQGNKSGLTSVQDQLTGQGQGGQLRTSLPNDIAQAAAKACGYMETPTMVGGPMKASQDQ